jgi:branched-chain amino acid transport system permease protein
MPEPASALRPISRMGRTARLLALGAGAGALVLLPRLVPNRFWVSVAITVLFKTWLTSSLRINHLIGRISLAQVGFMLVGAYTSALLSMQRGVAVPLAVLAGVACAALLAFSVGYPFSRVKGVYFVVLTLLMAETLRLTALYWQNLTGGETGIANIPSLPDLTLAGASWSLSETEHFYYFALLVTAALFAGLYRLERSRFGFQCRALAQSEQVCRAAGVNTTRLIVWSFTLGAAVAGLAGALWAHFESVLTPTGSSVFGLMSSVFLIVYLHVGGADHFFGPFLGVTGLTLIEQLSRIDERYVPLVLGASLIVMVFVAPRGVADVLLRGTRRLLPRLARPGA